MMLHKPTPLTETLNVVILTLWLTAWALRLKTGKYQPKDPAGICMIAGWILFAVFLYLTLR